MLEHKAAKTENKHNKIKTSADTDKITDKANKRKQNSKQTCQIGGKKVDITE